MHSYVYHIMDVNKIRELIPTVEVEEVHRDTVIKVETGNEIHGYYEVEIYTKHNKPQITINFFLGSDGWATIEFYGPNPEASIESLIRDAITLIEKYLPKKTEATETP
jgi:predicted DNA-binding protein (MmcQ/YjbR family)